MAPHEAEVGRAFLVMKPGFSHLQTDRPFGRHLLRVISFELNPGEAPRKAFTSAVKKIYAVMNKAPAAQARHYSATYAIVGAGSEDKVHYLLVGGLANWAAFGTKASPTLMEMLGKAYGKAQAKKLMSALDGAVKTGSAQFYRYAASLSYTPSH